jgi:hypothetical protein
MKALRIILLFVLTLNVVSIYSQNTFSINKVFYSGETLVYKVKWTFIRIGTITIKTTSCENNPDYIKVSMLVESNPSIPFLDIKEYNETIIDRNTLMSNSFYAFYQNGSDGTKYYTNYNDKSKTAVWKVYDVSTQKYTDSTTIYNCPRYVDGPSLFFFTRVNSDLHKTINVPTIIDGKIESTKINFTNTMEEIEIDALDDDAAIPVYAEVKVLLGNIKMELEGWERGSWNKQLSTAGAR